MSDDMQTITEQAAKDARDVFESYGSKAREAIDYMEQLIYATLRKTERALPAASSEDVRAGALHPDKMLPEAIRLIRIEASRDYPQETVDGLRHVAAMLETLLEAKP